MKGNYSEKYLDKFSRETREQISSPREKELEEYKDALEAADPGQFAADRAVERWDEPVWKPVPHMDKAGLPVYCETCDNILMRKGRNVYCPTCGSLNKLKVKENTRLG